MSDRKLFKPRDLILLLLLAAAALLFFFVPKTFSGKGSAAVVMVYGEEYTRVDLAVLDEPSSISVNSVTIVFEKDGAYISGSDCPDKVCVKTGRVSAGGSAVCVPEGVGVYVEGTGDAPDAVVY